MVPMWLVRIKQWLSGRQIAGLNMASLHDWTNIVGCARLLSRHGLTTPSCLSELSRLAFAPAHVSKWKHLHAFSSRRSSRRGRYNEVWRCSTELNDQSSPNYSYPNRIPTFHGYSFSGNASAEYVYVGRGQQVDFKRLQALGVELEGKIALAKYGGPFRGLKVKNAQEHGMIGAVIFSDPSDDGNLTQFKGVATYPDGPARNPTAVQRGSVQFLSIYPGDPTTPGYTSKEDSPRADKSGSVPNIPSLPISWLDAQPILQALNGFGDNGTQVNRSGWVGAIPGVTYSTGQGAGAKLSLSNVMEDHYTAIWDVVGIINGTNQDEVIIVGNHRDAWIVGGAADPNSGSAVLIELAKAFGKLQETGWKPTRTIVLCSWDAEEYGLVGR